MGHIRVIAGILDDARRGLVGRQGLAGQGKARPVALGQQDLDRIGKLARQQRPIGGLGRRRGAGAGGPAPAQGPARLVSHGAILKCQVWI